MSESRDYYIVLGVPHDASADEIKRAYARKRREYVNDEEKSTLLNQVYEVLCDPTKRKQYDLSMQFGNQLQDVKEKIKNSETQKEREKYLFEARKLYLNVLDTDAGNTDALWNLVGIEELLENDGKALDYLKQLEICTNGEEKIEVYQRQSTLYIRLSQIDDAIKSLYHIYQADVAYIEEIQTLARLCYEQKKNLKVAIQILNECVNRATEDRLKITYLYEVLRAIRTSQNESYRKVEETLYKKLETFHVSDSDVNLQNAAVIIKCLAEALDRRDIECFRRIEKVYLVYMIDNDELNQSFKAAQQIVKLMEAERVHKAIDLYLEDSWTTELRMQLGKYVMEEAKEIKESLEAIKKEAHLFWQLSEDLEEFEKAVDKRLRASNEYRSMLKDRTISSHMKKVISLLLLEGFVEYGHIREELVEAKDAFFEEDKAVFKHTLRKLEEYYPACFTAFSEVFLNGKSIDEFVGNSSVRKDSRECQETRQHEVEDDIQQGKGKKKSKLIKWIISIVAFLLIGEVFEGSEVGDIFIFGFMVAIAVSIISSRPDKAERERRREKRKRRIKKAIKFIVVIFGIATIISMIAIHYEKNRQEYSKDKRDILELLINKEDRVDDNEIPNILSVKMQDVLDGSGKFINKGHNYNNGDYQVMVEEQDIHSIRYYETMKISEESSWSYSGEFKAIRYAIVDMDGDGISEVIIECVNRDNPNEVEFLVLHEYTGDVYGYMFVQRGLCELHKNGIFSQSSGAAYHYVTRLEFDESNAECILLCNAQVDEFYEEYYIASNSVTQEEYNRFLETIGYQVGNNYLAEFYELNMNEENYMDTSNFDEEYEVNPDIIFELLRYDGQLVVDDVCEHLKIDMEKCEILSKYYMADDYFEDRITYDATFYGLPGYIECSNRIMDSRYGIAYPEIDISWYPYQEADANLIFYYLQDDSRYTEKYAETEDEYLFESEKGQIYYNTSLVTPYVSFEVKGEENENNDDYDSLYIDTNQVEWLCEEFRDLGAVYIVSHMDNEPNLKCTFDFSEEWVRQEALRYNMSVILGEDSNSASMRVFGIETSDIGEVFLGDWGMEWPELRNYDMSTIDGENYVVSAEYYMVSDFEEPYEYYLGSVTFYISTNEVSRYGYVVDKMVVRN